MNVKRLRDAKLARNRYWAIWCWYLLLPIPGSVVNGIRSGSWTGCTVYLTGLLLSLGLSFGLENPDIRRTGMSAAAVAGACTQTVLVRKKRQEMGIKAPEQADALYYQEQVNRLSS